MGERDRLGSMGSASILGIDFGTTNTAAVFFDKEGKLRLVPIKEKNFILPSVVWFRAADKVVVGNAARMQAIDDPKHTLFGVKRFLGRRYNSEFVARNKERFAFSLIEGSDSYAAVEIYGQILPLVEVIQHVLQQIVEHANHTAGETFTECVLTVPAHASIRQREATRRAAEKIGLKVRAMINEPTAAALYYANLRNPEQTVLVFDLGGGTFDATLMSVKNRQVNVLATGGDAFLGGSDFDEAIVAELVAEFQRQHGLDLRENKVVMQRLLFAAEAAKIVLSKQEATQVRIPVVAQGKDGRFIDFQYELTRAQLERLVTPLIERTVGACEDLLERAGMTADQVDELVLVGGQTRMPAIRARFSHFKRSSSEKDVHPDLAVAIGAAVLGRNLARGTSGLSDVVPMPISVMMPGGRTHEVIAPNTPVPCSKRVSIRDLPAWNAPIPLVVLESVDRTSVDREALGTVSVPPEWRKGQLKGDPQLELSMGQDFVLSARLVSSSGESFAAPIVEMKGR